MPNISSITHYPLKIIFAVHLFFVTWGLQGNWYPGSLMFYNLLFFLCLLWAIHNLESDEPIQFALFINVLSIFFDVIALSTCFPDNGWGKFYAAMMILNLIIRVVSSYSLLQIGRARGGPLSTMFAPSPALGFGRQEYEDMSQPVPNNADFA
ncbi:uncharacterized protein LOC124408959 [Diprion similis]|uniref:uncharacterized protein LOC124408959 n=1 Tax=Diprion similis TaxID=362088 RepID=UPI001EF8C0D0|nr:uncharacterized protein LOC124408959 [Diprion similis]